MCQRFFIRKYGRTLCISAILPFTLVFYPLLHCYFALCYSAILPFATLPFIISLLLAKSLSPSNQDHNCFCLGSTCLKVNSLVFMGFSLILKLFTFFSDNNTHTIFSPIFRLCFERFHDMLKTDQYLPDMPSLNPSTHEFEEKFSDYFLSDQYRIFANQMARVTKRFKETHLYVYCMNYQCIVRSFFKEISQLAKTRISRP